MRGVCGRCPGRRSRRGRSVLPRARPTAVEAFNRARPSGIRAATCGMDGTRSRSRSRGDGESSVGCRRGRDDFRRAGERANRGFPVVVLRDDGGGAGLVEFQQGIREPTGHAEARDRKARRRTAGRATAWQAVLCGPKHDENKPAMKRCSSARYGQVPKRPKGADCKSVGSRLRGFESLPAHQHFIRGEQSRSRSPRKQLRG